MTIEEETAKSTASPMPGVIRIMRSYNGRSRWYWQATWLQSRVELKELFSEAQFGPEEAKKLAIEAKTTEDNYNRLLKRGSPITKEERNQLTVERDAAFKARRALVSSKTSIEGLKLVRGVNYVAKSDRFVVTWIWRHKRIAKSFSCKKLGFEEAKNLAVAFRKKKDEARINSYVFPDFGDVPSPALS
jgi:hypothetical protein